MSKIQFFVILSFSLITTLITSSFIYSDIYLVTKWDRGNERSKNRLFRLPADAWSSGYNGAVRNYSVKAVGNYDYNRYQRNGGTHIMKTTWTAGEMSFDGTMIALGNLQKSYIFLRCPGTSVKDRSLVVSGKPS